MLPTRLSVKNKFLTLLDDPSGVLFTDLPTTLGGPSLFQNAFSEAYNALWTAFLAHQCPRIELIAYVTVPAGVTSLTPAQMGIADFGDFIYLSERSYGSQEKYADLNSVDRLTQRLPSDRLIEFNYRNDTFYFIGATTIRDLQIKYDTSGEAPTVDGTAIGVDSCEDFLANYAAGKAAYWKGYDELSQAYLGFAVGPKYNMGYIGGELFRLIQPRVRSRQHVQMAPKPYSTTRRIVNRRAIPYVASQIGTTGGTQNPPIQFSSADGTIVGPVDGVNNVFWLSVGGVTSMQVYVNGTLQIVGANYTSVNNQITFLAGSTPLTGNIITATVYLS
jgi:hypothetical protein